jgi:predicted O-linked N-acetylglucosamine transferase (SPINDLY family)
MWAGVLAAVPNSKLMIIANGEDSGTRNVLEGYGIPIERAIFMRRQGRSGYFRSFHDCDIALDSFPYAGQTTTCDAMWMGVPTVTMTGSTHHSRIGESLARAVGLEELVARSPEEFVQIAKRWAGELPRLAELRRTLRDCMLRSPLCDGHRVAAGLEARTGRCGACTFPVSAERSMVARYAVGAANLMDLVDPLNPGIRLPRQVRAK